MECFIRQWRLDDSTALARGISNPHVQENLRDGLPYPYTAEDGLAYILSVLSANRDKVFAFAVEREGQVIGSISITRGENIHSKTAELGYFLAEEYWGKGYMSQAVTQACERVFSTSDIIRIFATPFSDNTASCRVLEKAGFQLEGTLRKNAVKNGVIRDMRMYALTR